MTLHRFIRSRQTVIVEVFAISVELNEGQSRLEDIAAVGVQIATAFIDEALQKLRTQTALRGELFQTPSNLQAVLLYHFI